MQSFRVIDSHTGGEPTRTIVDGGPTLIGQTLQQNIECMKTQFDGYRRSIVNEPRGSEVMVGALLIPPQNAHACCGIVFFNNVGYLGMCGHGTIGVVATLAHLGRIQPGEHRFETVAGEVVTTLHRDGTVSVDNVPSYRFVHACRLHTSRLGTVSADIAYGGNWFCLVQAPQMGLLNRPVGELLAISEELLAACRQVDQRVDHVELFDAPTRASSNSRNFVLCPGGMYDRSPCGTGTSAKLACLASDGKLAEHEAWVQESIIGSTFSGSYRWLDQPKGFIIPTISGRAYINAESTILIDKADRISLE
jgi:4-hydroxyproline epimerase